MADDARLPAGHTADNRPPRYVEVGDDGRETVVYRASGLKTCDVAFVAYALGMAPDTPPDFIQRAYAEGNRFEPLILARLNEGTSVPMYGGGRVSVKLHDKRDDGEQDELEVEIGEINDRRVIVRLHPDGSATASWVGNPDMPAMVDVPVVMEVKSLGPDYWKKFCKGGLAGLGLYDWQVSAQIHATKNPCLFVCGEKLKNGELGEVLAQVVVDAPIPLRTFRMMAARVEGKIEDALNGGGLPECVDNQYPCPFWFVHTDAPEVDVEPPVQGDEELARLVEDERRWSRESKTAIEMHKDAKARIEKWLEANGAKGTGAWVRNQYGDTYDVQWVVQEKKEYTVPAGTSSWVQVKATAKKDLPNRVDAKDKPEPPTATPNPEDPFDGVNGERVRGTVGKRVDREAPRAKDVTVGGDAAVDRVIL